MDDACIVKLYLERDEEAISETEKKYGKYCRSVAFGILGSRDTADECVNDAYMQTWRSIPPHHPSRLGAFVAKITRNVSLNRALFDKRQKRSTEATVALDELSEVVGSDECCGSFADDLALSDAISEFLRSLPTLARVIFVRRYWYLYSVKDIARLEKITESNVKAILMRTRTGLREFLKKKGFYL